MLCFTFPCERAKLAHAQIYFDHQRTTKTNKLQQHQQEHSHGLEHNQNSIAASRPKHTPETQHRTRQPGKSLRIPTAGKGTSEHTGKHTPANDGAPPSAWRNTTAVSGDPVPVQPKASGEAERDESQVYAGEMNGRWGRSAKKHTVDTRRESPLIAGGRTILPKDTRKRDHI